MIERTYKKMYAVRYTPYKESIALAVFDNVNGAYFFAKTLKDKFIEVFTADFNTHFLTQGKISKQWRCKQDEKEKKLFINKRIIYGK